MTRRRHTLLFDFDGTISLGPGPVLAYARLAAAALPVDDATTFMETVSTGLRGHPHGRVPGSGAIDGYDFVRVVAGASGIDTATLGRAYLDSREQLATPLAPVFSPDGLPEFLSAARTRATLIVATNAPATRLNEAIDELGLGGLFDTVYPAVGKPAGLGAILDDWMSRGEVLSIGDIWANDLAPAHDRGAFTALIGPHSPEADTATPDLRAEHLHELYPLISNWLAGAPISPPTSPQQLKG